MRRWLVGAVLAWGWGWNQGHAERAEARARRYREREAVWRDRYRRRYPSAY